MKKILFLLAFLLIVPTFCYSGEEEIKLEKQPKTPIIESSNEAKNDVIEGKISFDWVSKTQLERNKKINEVKKIIYSENVVTKYKKSKFKAEYEHYLKDKNYKEHYLKIINGEKETATERFAGFYAFNDRMLYMYAIQYKNNPRYEFYYDTLGNLRYVDVFSENFPNYPFYSHKYYVNGELIESAYFESETVQYIFKDNKFAGVCFNDTIFNEKAKKIMTRTNY